jgi:hypothetical protein
VADILAYRLLQKSTLPVTLAAAGDLPLQSMDE